MAIEQGEDKRRLKQLEEENKRLKKISAEILYLHLNKIHYTMKKEDQLMEIYKIHVGLSDKVSERRGQTNKFYITILSAILALMSFVVKDGKIISGINFSVILLIVGILGVLLCIVWYLNIKSYRQLNTGKFKALHEIEEQISYPFFKREWELLGEGKKPGIYFQLSKVEQLTPVVLLIPYLLIVIYSIMNI